MASHGARQMPAGSGPDDPDLCVCYVCDSIGANLRSGGARLDHLTPTAPLDGGVEVHRELHRCSTGKVGGLAPVRICRRTLALVSVSRSPCLT